MYPSQSLWIHKSQLSTKFQEILTAHLEIHTTYTNNSNITPTNIKVNTSTQWKNAHTYTQDTVECNLTLEIPPIH